MAMEPGWYPDPFSSGGYVRWWDGQRWGASTSVETTAPTSSVPGAPLPMPPPPLPPPPGPMAPVYGVPTGVAPFPLASWGARAVARIIDSFVTALITLPFILWLVWPSVQRFMDSIPAGGAAPSDAAITALQSDLLAVSTSVTAITLLVSLAYEVPQNKAWGRTLGKRVLGLRIRPRAADVPLSWGQVLARWGSFEAFSIIAGGLLLVVDLLWPLWDRPWRQAVHDKIARTIVVPTR